MASKHVYVTGGSSGLGLAFSILLVQRGAHVSIVARDQTRLDSALAELEKHRVSTSQILQARSYRLETAQASIDALEDVCKTHGGSAPDAVFTCAGAARPMFFIEMTEDDLAVARKMAKQKKHGKIVLVASMVGYISFIGWGSYAPGKHGLRGLADTLQSELMLYNIGVQIYFPPTMFTRGLDEENQTKPDILKQIESTEEGTTPERGALALLRGAENGEAHITGELLASLFRASTRGTTHRANWFLDALLNFVAYIAMPIWRSSVDRQVLGHREEHQKYLEQKGFFVAELDAP